MTRTSRARIRPFTRICGCRLDLSPYRQNGSAPHRRISLSQFPASAFANARSLIFRHGCDSPPRSTRISIRKSNRSCRQQFRTGKIKLLTTQSRRQSSTASRFAAGEDIPRQLSRILINSLVDRQSALYVRHTRMRPPAWNRLLPPAVRVSPRRKKRRGRRSPCRSQMPDAA